MQGIGKMIYYDINYNNYKEEYIGEWENNKKNGKGKMIYYNNLSLNDLNI